MGTMMSDRAARATFKDSEWWRSECARDAESEARWILESTEPDFGNIEAIMLADVAVIRREQAAHPDPITRGHSALAESLAAILPVLDALEAQARAESR